MQTSRLLALAVVLFGTLSHAQQPAAPQPTVSGQNGNQAATKSIRLDVTVTSRDGKTPPPELQQKDFTLLDNKSPQPLTSFTSTHMEKAPVRVMIVIDALNIRFTGLEYARSEVAGFLKAHPKLPQRTAVAVFTEKGIQSAPAFTTDGSSLKDWLDTQTVSMRTLRNSTGIYGAEDRYSLSVKALKNLAFLPSGPKERTVILWISPGWPILSGPRISLDAKMQNGIFSDIVSFSTLLREQRITLYAIDPIGANESVGRTDYYEEFLKGISKPSQVDLGDLSLQVLAIQSGGRAANSNDTGMLIKQAYADLESYYVVTFDTTPTEKPNVYHHLEMKLAEPELIAITRDGYYAQP